MVTLSHSKSSFYRPPDWQKQPWAQPREEARNWMQQHAMYAAKAAQDDAELVFYGDRMTELWRGTIHMEPDPRTHGVHEVFHEYFGHIYKTAVFGISGDTTSHLMWRLTNGEAPAPSLAPKAAVVLIGTNDLTLSSFQGDTAILAASDLTAERISAIAEEVHEAAPLAKVLLLGLLPRGDQTLMPDPGMFAQPSKFSLTIEVINKRLQDYCSEEGHLQFLDCGQAFLTSDGSALDPRLMPDALHPNAAGMEALARCLQPAVVEAVGH